MIYLDNAATTKPSRFVTKVVAETMENIFGNPSSFHRIGVHASEYLETCRRQIANFIGLTPECLFFTGSATEANQWVLKGATKTANKRRNHILISAFEHSSILETRDYLTEKGYEVELLIPDQNGYIDPQKVGEKMRETTELISIIGVHNELGTIQDVTNLNLMIKDKNPQTLFHVDGVQWFGKIKTPSEGNWPDFFTISGHKMHGPKGVGGLIKKNNVQIKPLLHGGGQEKKLRSGTENLPAIAGFAQAVAELNLTHSEKLFSLQNEIFHFATSHAKLRWIGFPPGKQRSPYISLISFQNKKSETLIHQLEENKIYVSSGSACSEKSNNKKQWQFLNLPSDFQDGIIRISFNPQTNHEEVTALLNYLKAFL